jgi:hypothetical protein
MNTQTRQIYKGKITQIGDLTSYKNGTASELFHCLDTVNVTPDIGVITMLPFSKRVILSHSI